MKKNILFWVANLLFVFLCHSTSEAWGPKFRIELSNGNNPNCSLYVGVDTLATDGHDSLIVFYFDTLELREFHDLPPAPPGNITFCYIVRDTLMPNDSKSYVDIRSIPTDQDEFFHRYRLEVSKWAIISAYPVLTINWGKLPDGIDSAKIVCRGCGRPDVDMRENEEFVTDNDFHRRFDILVWYNKKHISVEENFDFAVSYFIDGNWLRINSNDFQTINIYSILGEKLISSQDDNINIAGLSTGVYFIKFIDKAGRKKFHNFIQQ